jgi:hypothetical protein
VQATVRYAAELDYEVTMVKDATADYSDEEMHAALDFNIPNYASAILTTTETTSGLPVTREQNEIMPQTQRLVREWVSVGWKEMKLMNARITSGAAHWTVFCGHVCVVQLRIYASTEAACHTRSEATSANRESQT